MADKGEKSTGVNVTPHSLVTEENVRAALKADKGSDAQLVSWSVVDFTKPGDNYACVVSSVEVKFSLHGQNSEVVYVVKLNPCRALECMKVLTLIAFEKEVKFYLILVPELNSLLNEVGFKSLRVPRCLYGSVESDKEIVFLEDLRARGFRMVEGKQGLDVAHATLIVEELARLHAASCLLQDRTPGQDLTVTYDFLLKDWATKKVKGMEDLMTLLQKQVKAAVEILKNIEGYETAATWAESLIPKIPDIFDEQLSMTRYNVICHGDCWNNNILFRYDDEGEPVEVMLLDLQINRFASPATDLSYFLYSSLTGDVRKPNLDAFLSTYHTTFTTVMDAAGKDMIFTLSQLKDEFKDKILVGALIGMAMAPIILMEPEDIPDFSKTNNEEYDKMLDDLKSKTVELFHTNSLLPSRFLSIFDELMEAKIIA